MANNPIKYSDFIQPDGSVTDLISQLEKLQTTYVEMLAKVRSEASKMEEAVKKANSATEAGREATKNAAAETDKLAKEYAKLEKAQSDTGKEIAALRLQQQKQNQINKLQAKLNDSLEGSYDRLSAQYSLNKIELNKMSAAERANTKAGRELEQNTKDIYEEMKKLQEATGKHTLSVGDYTKGWKGLKVELDQIPGATSAVVGGFNSMSTAAKSFLANPIVLVIAAIVGGLAALYSGFKKTKAGSDLLSKGAAALEGVMSALVGIVDGLYTAMIKLFEDPQKAMDSFWEVMKKNIVNRFEGLMDLLGAVGKAFKSLWERDLSGLKNAADEAGTALIQLGTGLDTEQQKEFAAAIAETTKNIKEQAQAFAELEEARINTRRANRELEKSVEDLITQEELLQAVADDTTKSFAEREKAANEASALTVKRAAIQQKIARDNLSLINQELALRQKNGEDVEDLLDQQLDYYKTLKQAQREALLAARDNEKRQSELKQDRLEKDLDILIDGFDNQKAINERIIADESKSFELRAAKLNETKALFESTFNKQIETIQKFTGIQINANELIGESDAVLLNQKIRSLGLSEIIEGRLLEIIRERRTASQDLAEAEKDLADEQFKAQKEALDKEIAARIEAEKKKEAIIEEANARTLELEKQQSSSIRNLISASLDSALQMRVASVDKEIEKSNEKYDALLENENLTEEQREAIEAQKEKKEEELQKKREKREKQNFLIQQGFALGEIAIEAAKGVATATAQAPGTFGASLAWIPLIIGTAAAQAGIVIAQTIPQLWTGGELTESGKVMINDDPFNLKGSDYREVVQLPSGELKFPQGKNKIMHLPKGTKVYPSYDAFMEANHLFNLQGILDAKGISMSHDFGSVDEIRALRRDVNAMGTKFEKVASRPINVTNKVILDDKRPYY